MSGIEGLFSKPAVFNTGLKIAKKVPILGSAVGIAEDIGSALGLGKSQADYRKERFRKFVQAIRDGDWAKIEGAPNSQYGSLRNQGAWVMQQRALGYSLADMVRKLDENDGKSGWQKAREGILPNLDGSPFTQNFSGASPWAQTSTGGTVPAPQPIPAPAGSSGSERTGPRPTRRSGAPIASTPTPRPPRACTYGPRGADGYCPPKPKRVAAPLANVQRTPRAKPNCKFGPRGADGYCPSKPPRTAYGSDAGGRLAEAVKAKAAKEIQRRAETAVGNAAADVAKTVIKNLGPAGTFRLIAKASLVGAAGIAAYALTSKLMKLKFKTWQDLKNEVGQQAIAAKRSARITSGIPADQWTPQLNAQEFGELNKFVKERLAVITALESQNAAPPRDIANLVFSDD